MLDGCALEQIETLRPDVAVLDIAMPGLSGIDVAHRMRYAGLPTAIEIDAQGNRVGNGLCEAGETCLYTPNFGAYQGRGPLVPVEPIDGTLTDVTLYRHATVDWCSQRNLNANFDARVDSVEPWVLFGDAWQSDDADSDPPEYATIGDERYGIAFGAGRPGLGGIQQNIEGAAVEPGHTYELSADFHIDPSFQPGRLELRLEFWGSGSIIGTASNDITADITNGSDPTDPLQWETFAVSGVVPAGTIRIRAVVEFEETTLDVFGGRLDRAFVTDLDADCERPD